MLNALLLARIIQVAIGLISIKIGTWILSVEQYSIYSLALIVQSFAGFILISPAGQFVAKYMTIWHGLYSTVRIGRMFFVYTVLAGIVNLLVFSFICNFDDGFVIGLLILFNTVATAVFGTASGVINNIGQSRVFCIAQISSSIIGLTVSSLGSFVTHDVKWWIVGAGIGQATASLYIIPKLLATKESLPNKVIEIKSLMADYIAPLLVYSLASWFLYSGVKIYVEQIEPENFAMFVIGVSISSQIWAAAEPLLFQVLTPCLYKLDNGSRNYGVNLSRLIFNSYKFVFFITVSIVFIGPSFQYLLVDHKFKDAVQYISYGAVVDFYRVFGSIAATFALVKGVNRLVSNHNMLSALICVVGFFLVSLGAYNLQQILFCQLFGLLLGALFNIRMLNKEIGSAASLIYYIGISVPLPLFIFDARSLYPENSINAFIVIAVYSITTLLSYSLYERKISYY